MVKYANRNARNFVNKIFLKIAKRKKKLNSNAAIHKHIVFQMLSTLVAVTVAVV